MFDDEVDEAFQQTVQQAVAGTRQAGGGVPVAVAEDELIDGDGINVMDLEQELKLDGELRGGKIDEGKIRCPCRLCRPWQPY